MIDSKVVKRSGCNSLDGYVYRSALISECGRYRYELKRRWSVCLPLMHFIMLNPSTADALMDDPTIRRCIGFARREGAGGIVVYNLFTLRATDPQELLRSNLPLNDGPSLKYLQEIPWDTMVICAWGGSGKVGKLADLQAEAVRKALPHGMRLFCLGRTKDGRPKHPLYLAGDTKIEELRP